MSDAPDSFRFFQVNSTDAQQAFNFHKSISDTNEHIWPRTEAEIKRFAEEGELFAVIRESSGEFVGLCYSHLDEEEKAWEIGGLTVTEKFRKLYLGSFLVRFALAHTISTGDPWKYGQRIIAHVHSDNRKPRDLLKRINFEFLKPIEVPADVADKVPSMKRNENGKITGDEFEFKKASVRALYQWFASEFNGYLGDAESVAKFDYGDVGIENVLTDLQTLADE